MTPQQLFDKVGVHLLTQRAKSLSGPNNECAYRGAGGLRCAAGCVILDSEYRAEFEGASVDVGVSSFMLSAEKDVVRQKSLSVALENSGVPRNCFLMLRRLQIIHDDNEPSEWYRLLRCEALLCGLSTEAIDNL